jgi:hypothetical protein
MYHSIIFGEKNTYDDWKLVPCERPVFAAPTQKTTFLDIPGADGSLDVSESLTGYPVYNDREGTFDFYVLNEYTGYYWMDIYSDIMECIHGKRLHAILEDDPKYYYDGRFWIDKWNPDAHHSTITIKYRVNPYKWSVLSSSDTGWLWDSFNFNEDMISSAKYKDIIINNPSTTSYNIVRIPQKERGSAPICPDFIVSSMSYPIKVKNGVYGVEHPLSIGHNVIHDIMLYGPTESELYFNGLGLLSIEFRKGRF